MAGGVAIALAAVPKGHKSTAASPRPTNATPATPTPPLTKASPLTGLQVEPAAADRPVTAVIIENQTESRPQSGLSQAGVVYEALAEGGITRFLAIFLDQRPTTLGPIRSLRTYFIDWALEYDAPVAHAGGNADALDLIRPLGLTSLNQFSYGGNYYRSTDRYAPHNLYTSSDLLDKLRHQLGIEKVSTFAPAQRKLEAPEPTPSHPRLAINYSYGGYQVEYDYDAKTNDYARLLAGVPHIDRTTGQPIRVKNVVVEIMPTSYGNTRLGEQTVIMQTVGRGRALVFRDGGVVEATWNKANHAARTKLIDASGQEVALNNGITWYAIVPPGQGISF